MRRLLSLIAVILSSVLTISAQQINPDTEMLIRLSAPGINSKTAAVGDEIRGTVEQPTEFAGYGVIGHVIKASSTGKIKGQSVMQFKFERLEKGTQVIPIQATLKQVTNSKGAPNVDEEGRVIKKKGHTGKVVAGTLGGALIGGLLGGGKGAALGAAVGAGASIAAIEIGAEKGADFELAADSLLLLVVNPGREGMNSSTATVIGDYKNQANQNDQLSLFTDGTFNGVQSGRQFSGTYKQEGSTVWFVMGNLQSKSSLDGSVIVDDQGIRWVRVSQ